MPVPEPLFAILAMMLSCVFCFLIYEDLALSLYGRVDVGIVTEYVPVTSIIRKRHLPRTAHYYKIQIGEKSLQVDLKREGMQSRNIPIVYLPDDLTVASYYPGSRNFFSLVWSQFGFLALIPSAAILLSMYSVFGYLHNWKVIKRRDCELATYSGR